MKTAFCLYLSIYQHSSETTYATSRGIITTASSPLHTCPLSATLRHGDAGEKKKKATGSVAKRHEGKAEEERSALTAMPRRASHRMRSCTPAGVKATPAACARA